MRVLRPVVVVFLAWTVGLAPAPAAAEAVTPAFTYQGRLQDGGPPATGPYDFQFALFGSVAGTDQVGPTLTVGDVNVAAGFFTVPLDFGPGVFDGNRRWLEVRVRPGASSGAYTTLSPRQELTAAPNAVFSQVAPWAGLSGVPAGFADNTDNDALGGLSCANGQIAKRSGGAWVCAADADSGGTITGITAGAGLTGGGTSGVVPLDVNLAGSGSATTVSRSDHDHLGQLWSGNTSGVNFTVRNIAVDGTALAGVSTATTGFGSGIYAQTNAENGAAVYAVAGSATGANAGVAGGTASPAGIGVSGYASSATGFALGVQGHTYSTQGIGVWGYNSNPAATDFPIGVEGRSDSPIGVGVNGFVPATSGANIAVRGATSSPEGWAGYFLGRAHVSGQLGVGTTTPTAGTMLDVNGVVRSGTGGFRFPDGTTQATAATNPTADITAVNAGTGLTGGGTSGAVTLNVNLAGSGAATTVSRSDHDHGGQSWTTSGTGLTVTSSGGDGLRGVTSGAFVSGVHGESSATNGWGIRARSTGTGGNALFAEATGGGGTFGVWGRADSPNGTGVAGIVGSATGPTNGVYGRSSSPAGFGGLFENNGGGFAVGLVGGGLRFADNSVQITAAANPAADVTGVAAGAGLTGGGASGDVTLAVNFAGSGAAATASRSDHDHVGQAWSGVAGGAALSVTNTQTTGFSDGIYGITSSGSGWGVAGQANVTSGSAIGVFGYSQATTGYGVYAQAAGSTGVNYGLFALQSVSPDGYAGYFSGRVHVAGTLSKSAGSFKIDHPLDPENKYLYHSFVESPDMKNIYDGVVTTGPDGFATVEMPEWFEALNRDFRYQLTVIGDGAWARARVFRKIAGGQFVIQTDVPGTEVSWQVTGIRKDAFAEKHRIPVEQEKPEDERGTYLHPEAWDQPQEAGLDHKRHPMAGRKQPGLGRPESQ